MRDPYELLEVDRHATAAEIRAAFRRLAATHHPDRNPDDPGAQDRFQEVNAAHQILSDPQKRAAFDRYGPAAFAPGGMGAAGAAGGFAGLDDLVGDLLGVIGIRTGNRGDLRKKLRLSFEEAALGCTRQLDYERTDRCDRCHGAGGEPGSEIGTCPTCGGRGRVRLQRGFVSLPIERGCRRCRGSGQVPRTRCARCNGRGLRRATRSVTVDIPAGTAAGETRVLARGGDRPRPDRPPGDLEVVLEIAPHAVYRRDGDDVRCELPISFSQATLGGQLEVPTLDGPIRLLVPPGTQTGSVLRARGKGIPHRRRSGRGDQLVEVRVGVPTELTDRARELITELGHELGDDVSPVAPQGLLDRLKRFLG